MHVSKDAADGCHASPQQPQDYSAVLDALHQPVQRPPLPLCEVPPLPCPLQALYIHPCTHLSRLSHADRIGRAAYAEIWTGRRGQ